MPSSSAVAYGRALYYPYIQFRNDQWVKAAALYYDGLDRILPPSVTPDDSHLVKVLNDEENFTRNLDPQPTAEKIAMDFFDYAANELKDPVLRSNMLEKFGIHYKQEKKFAIHLQKMGRYLHRELPTLGLSFTQDPSHPFLYHLDGATAAIYMTYLANHMAGERHLPLVTDDPDFQLLIRGMQSVPHEAWEDKGPLLASMVIETVVPRNLDEISASQIIQFRRQFKDERTMFYDEIGALVSEMELMDHPLAIQDCLARKHEAVLRATKNLERSYSALKIATATALLCLSVPAFVSGLGPGIAAGAIMALAAGRAGTASLDYYRSRKSNPYSYVLALKTQLDKENLAQQLLKGQLIL